MQGRLSRGVAIVGSFLLSIGLATTGIAVRSASATPTEPGINTSTKVITIGATAPFSGIVGSGYGDGVRAANAVFKYVNAKGGVNSWRVNFIIKDDCYDAIGIFGCTSRLGTVAQTRMLVEKSNVFAMVGSFGTEPQDQVRNYLDGNGVPQLFVNSGSKDWDHSSTWSGLFGFQPSYLVESKILANYVLTHFKGKKVGTIGQNNDFGADGLQGLLNGGLTVATADRHTYSATDLIYNADTFKTSLRKLQASKVRIVVLHTVPAATKVVLDNARKMGYRPQFVIANMGADPQMVNTVNEKNALSFSYLPNAADATNPWNAWMKKVLLADRVDFPTLTSTSVVSVNMQNGAAWAVAFLEVLNQLNGAKPTRQSVVAAMATDTGIASPTVVRLRYTNFNHQGLTGGYVIKISSKTSSVVADKQIYITGDGPLANSPLVRVAGSVSPIPSWLR
jgi:branched-chain amino acid transport system substrate-binding protein